LALGLIDQIGYLEDAIQYATTTAGLKNPEVIKYQDPTSFFSLLSSESDSSAAAKGLTIHLDASALDRLQSPQAMYLYRPSAPTGH
jgi:protease-4